MKLLNTQHRPKIYTLTDGETLRILPHKEVEVKNSLLTDVINKDIANGTLREIPSVTVLPKKKKTRQGGIKYGNVKT